MAVKLEAPSRAQAGQVLGYAVTLQNEGQQPLALDPCPAYTVAVGNGDAVGGAYEQLLLNCDAAPASIAVGASVRFELQLPVPADVQGKAVLRWDLSQYPGDGVPHSEQAIRFAP